MGGFRSNEISSRDETRVLTEIFSPWDERLAIFKIIGTKHLGLADSRILYS